MDARPPARRATHLCKGIIERDIETLVPDHAADIVLYCGGGYRSALAADNLCADGLHGRHLDGRRLARAGPETAYPVAHD